MAARVPSKPETALAPAATGTVVPPRTPAQLASDEKVAGAKRRIQMIAEHDEKVVAAVGRFRDLPMPWEEEHAKVLEALATNNMLAIAQLGFKSRRELRLALYGQKPKKDVPYGVIAANERVQARSRLEAKRAPSGKILVQMVNIPAPRPITEADAVVVVRKEPSRESD